MSHFAESSMKLSGYFLAVCTIAYAAPCVTEDAAAQLAQPGGRNTKKVEREVVRIDLSERNDLKLEESLDKVRQNIKPIIVDLTWSKVADLLKNLHGLKNLQGLYPRAQYRVLQDAYKKDTSKSYLEAYTER